MKQYIIRRLIGAFIVMWAVATLVFVMMRLVPGDPLAAMLFDAADPDMVEELRRQYGLDQPIYVQYFKWFWQVLQGNLGSSIYGSRTPVTTIIAEAFPRTMSLATLGFFFALIIAVPAGLISAIRKHSAMDHTVTVFAFIGLSMPDFWLAILLIIVFAAKLQVLPAIGYVPLSQGFWPWLSHIILPAFAIGVGFAAIITRMIRSSMLEILKTDYMRVAQAKGLREFVILTRHGFPNALIPVLTVMGIALALLLAGAVVVENVFAIKGLGRVLIEGILNRDYPVVQGAIIAVSAIFVFANLIVDLLYGVVDPRIRFE
ncbi:MAG: ABC transporter permease [Hyphomicrobiaceae bacterium]|nr:ABC transporter permease [Hyphomicrobiaceae bacterium]